MVDFIANLLESDFMPHAHCFLWKPGVLWLHVVSDAVIALAYFSIPLALAVLARRRPGTLTSPVLLLFATFIFACGLTHVLAIWTMWDPVYRLEGVMKAATAAVSIATAVSVWPLLPRILAVPNPAELTAANEALRREMGERREAEARFRTLLETSPDAMVIVDGLGSIVLVNQQTERLFGFSRDALVGKPIEMLVPEDVRDAHAEHRARFARERLRRPMGAGRELFGLRYDGTQFPIEISLSPIETPEGLLVSAAIRDISDRLQAQRTLRELNEQLSQRVDDRTAELARRASELARSNEELEQFAYVVSHDLKSPMRGIASLAQWLEADYGEQLDGDGRSQLDLIRRRAERMYELVDGVLSYSRATSRADRKEAINLGDLVADVVDSLQPPASVAIQIGSLPEITCGRTQMTQVFQNLIGNAIRHLGREHGRIEVSSRDALDRWEFRVSDDGPGIAPEHHERIFRIFQTLGPRDEERVGGLGLAIAKKIVESYGGRIWLESILGEGATFYFSLPK